MRGAIFYLFLNIIYHLRVDGIFFWENERIEREMEKKLKIY